MSRISILKERAQMNSKEFFEDRILSVEKAFCRIYKTKLKPDVEIRLKSEEFVCHFKAHKFILATRSSVFADLFWNTSNSETEVVTVDGVTENGLELLLEYIYNDNWQSKTVDELVEVSKAARRFEVSEVVRNCKRQLNKYALCIDNVFYVLEGTKYFKMEWNHDKCMRFIKLLSPDILFKAPGFLQLSGLSIYNILRQRDTSFGCEARAMEGVIRWLVHNKIKGRKLLSEINILSLTSEEYLNIIEKFPDFFTPREVASVLSNLLRPGCTELPSWCRSQDNFILETATYHSVMSKSLKFKTDCNRPFTKYSLYGDDGFQETIIFEIKLTKQFPERIYLTMLELGFGYSFVPEDHLQLELFHFGEGGSKMINVKFHLESTNDHYYIILNNRLKVLRNYPSILKITILVSGLRAWGAYGPASNRKYRVAQVPEDIFYNMRLNGLGCDPICLTPLSDWLLLLAPSQNEKEFVLTSFYFDLRDT